MCMYVKRHTYVKIYVYVKKHTYVKVYISIKMYVYIKMCMQDAYVRRACIAVKSTILW